MMLSPEDEQKANEALERLVRFVARYGVHAPKGEDLDALEDLTTLKNIVNEEARVRWAYGAGPGTLAGNDDL